SGGRAPDLSELGCRQPRPKSILKAGNSFLRFFQASFFCPRAGRGSSRFKFVQTTKEYEQLSILLMSAKHCFVCAQSENFCVYCKVIAIPRWECWRQSTTEK